MVLHFVVLLEALSRVRVWSYDNSQMHQSIMIIKKRL